jgi:DNA processing protein
VSGINFEGPAKLVKKEVPELNGNEKLIYETIASEKEAVHIDFISESSGLNISDCLVTLLNLEFKGLMEQLPGKRFKVSGS